MIRHATDQDTYSIVRFCLDCHDSMGWSEYGISGDVDSIARVVQSLIHGNWSCCFVVDEGSGVVGVCSAVASPFIWDKSLLISQEVIWHMHPDYPSGHKKNRCFIDMLDIMIAWAKSVGAKSFKASASLKYPAALKLLERRGLRQMETVCMGVL